MDAQGIVGKVIPRNTKVGITYSFTLDDRNDERWFGTYKTMAPAEGMYVEFEYKKNPAGFLNVDMDTLVVKDPGSAPETASDDTGVTERATKAASKAGNKDAKITWQAARKDAMLLLGLMGEDLKLGAGKKEAKLEVLLILVNQLTLDFFDQACEVAESGDAPEGFRG